MEKISRIWDAKVSREINASGYLQRILLPPSVVCFNGGSLFVVLRSNGGDGRS